MASSMGDGKSSMFRHSDWLVGELTIYPYQEGGLPIGLFHLRNFSFFKQQSIVGELLCCSFALILNGPSQAQGKYC